MHKHKKTKIVCTIGPATWEPAVMQKLIESGMNVARLNGAFADRAEMLKVEKLVRQFSDEVAMMIDIKGPEVRLNKFPQPVALAPGQKIFFGSDESAEIYPENYPETYKKLDAGQIVMVGDGDVKLVVTHLHENGFDAEVIFGETLKPGKALNFPGLVLNESPITEKDLDLLGYAKERGWDYVSASFISTKKSAIEVLKQIEGSNVKLCAKIEDAAGVANLDAILPHVHSVMLARGGLGVSMGLDKIAVVVKEITEKCHIYGKPVITATQMLDNMEDNPTPTRAEANDVGIAMQRLSDAVMLSGETSAGKYPVEAVQFLRKVDQEVYKHFDYKLDKALKIIDRFKVDDARTRALKGIATQIEDQNLDIIYAYAQDLDFINLLAKFAFEQPIVALISEENDLHYFNISRNIIQTYKFAPDLGDRDETIRGITSFMSTKPETARIEHALIIAQGIGGDAEKVLVENVEIG